MKDGERAFADGIGKLAGILTHAAGELDDLAKRFETGDEGTAEPNACKTGGVVKPEDALEGISGILNVATAKIAEMTAVMFDGHKQTEGT